MPDHRDRSPQHLSQPTLGALATAIVGLDPRLRALRRYRPWSWIARRVRPEVLVLETRALLTAFTMTSPVGLAPLLSEIPPAGGIVLDLIGLNGGRVEAQVAPSALFRGTSDAGTPASGRGNPVTLGIQSGLAPDAVRSLGGGLIAVAVRLTTSQGGTGPGEPFRDGEILMVNGIPLGNFSDVVTEQTTADGLTALSSNPAGGFRSGSLDTGFFSSTDPTLAARLYASILQTGKVVYQVQQGTTTGQVWDFTTGLDPTLVSPRQTPVLAVNPPLITGITTLSPIDEGASSTITVTARVARQNQNQPPPLDYQFDVNGDGSYALSSAAGVATIAFERPGTYTIPIRVVTTQGTFALGQTTVTVRNVAPTLVSPGDQPASEGTPASINLGRFTDPGPDAPWTVRLDWGDGSAPETEMYTRRGSLGQAGHTYLQQGSYDVTLTITDDLGLSSSETFRVNVQNVPPTLSDLTVTSPVEEGQEADLSFRFSDPGPLDAFTIRIDWGDQTTTTGARAGSPQAFAIDHLYAASGTYVVTVTVDDDGGGEATATATIVVQAAPPVVSPAPPVVPPTPRIPGSPPPADLLVSTLAFFSSNKAQAPAAYGPYQTRFGPAARRKDLAQSLPVKPGGPGAAGDEPPPGGRSLEQILALLLAKKDATAAGTGRVGPGSSGGQNALARFAASNEAAAGRAGATVPPGPPAPGVKSDDVALEEKVAPRGRATRLMMLVVWTLSLRHQRRRTRSRPRQAARVSGAAGGDRL